MSKSVAERSFTSSLPPDLLARKLENATGFRVREVEVTGQPQVVSGRTGSKVIFRLMGSLLPGSWRWIPGKFEITNEPTPDSYHLRIALDMGVAMVDAIPDKNTKALDDVAERIVLTANSGD